MAETGPLRRKLGLSEIHRLKARYCRYVDTKQWEAPRAPFTTAPRFEGFGSAPRGAERQGFVTGVSTRLADAVSVHHWHMPETEFTGPDEACGIWAMEASVDFPRGRDVLEAPGQRGYRGYGHYEQAYRREGEAWRFSCLWLTHIRIDPVPQAAPPPRAGKLSASPGWLGAAPDSSKKHPTPWSPEAGPWKGARSGEHSRPTGEKIGGMVNEGEQQLRR